MKIIIAIAVLAALFGILSIYHKPSVDGGDKFVSFVAKYRKSYLSSAEFNFRFQ